MLTFRSILETSVILQAVTALAAALLFWGMYRVFRRAAMHAWTIGWAGYALGASGATLSYAISRSGDVSAIRTLSAALSLSGYGVAIWYFGRGSRILRGERVQAERQSALIALAISLGSASLALVHAGATSGPEVLTRLIVRVELPRRPSGSRWRGWRGAYGPRRTSVRVLADASSPRRCRRTRCSR
ncbi:MAG: hypothetical protein K2X99_05680 [Gemmatimonadaceae bacterium]|nr:hypothetical protein [Gemmatimonadaceae bacterium]